MCKLHFLEVIGGCGSARGNRSEENRPCYPPAVSAALDPVLELVDVGLTVRNQDAERRILDAVSLVLNPGERLTLVGRSGSGKSTILRLANRLIEPSAGSVRFCGRDLSLYDPGTLRRDVALVGQEPIWLPGDAETNLMAAHTLGLVSDDSVQPRLREAMTLSGIDEAWLPRTEDQLSLGQRQRIALGRVLFNRPRVVLLDEPASALDPPSARDLMGQLRGLGEKSGMAMIMVTHRLDDARAFGTRTAVLEAGRIVADGPTESVLRGLETRWQNGGSS